MEMAIPHNLKTWLESTFGERVRFDEPMSRHTSFRIGGPADALVFPETKTDLAILVRTAVEANVPWLVIGGGTNLLVKDHGIKGVVVTTVKMKNTMEAVKISETSTHVRTSSGTKLSTLCSFARTHGLAGMNFATGIPGTVGGAIAMNAGTVEGAIQDVLHSIEYLSPDGLLQTAGKSDFRYAYRNFGVAGTNGSEAVTIPVIVEALFELTPGNPEEIDTQTGIALDRGAATQPSGKGGAGCFFKNPSSRDPAGKLIDLAGLKGQRIGGACVSEKHANYIVNSGTATAEDVLALCRMIQDRVFQKFQIQLEPEVRIVG